MYCSLTEMCNTKKYVKNVQKTVHHAVERPLQKDVTNDSEMTKSLGRVCYVFQQNCLKNEFNLNNLVNRNRKRGPPSSSRNGV